MRAFIVFSTLATSAVNGLVFPRQDACAVDSCQQALQSVSTANFDCAAYLNPTATITNGYTFVTGINVQTTITTSVVTAHALSADAPQKRQVNSTSSTDTCAQANRTAEASNAMPSYAAVCSGNDAYASACGCAFSMAATTKTYKTFAPTATVTSTYTYSEVAQATQTLQACNPDEDFGYFRGTIEWNSDFNGGQVGFPIGQPHQIIFANSTMEGCCLQCYQLGDAGCLQYEWIPDNSTCALMVNDGSCPKTPEDRLQVILSPNDEKPLVGVGTCDVEVQSFDG